MWPPLAARRRGLSFSILMPWTTFTSDHVKSRVSDDEIEVYESVANSGVGDTKLPAIISQVCDLFRGACLSNPNLTFLGPAGTIPDFCVFHAATKAVNALLGLPPVAEGMTSPRRDAERAADDFLKIIKEMNSKAFEETPATSETSNPSSGGSALLEF